MCDYIQSVTVIANRCSGNQFRKLGIAQCSWHIKPVFLTPEVLNGYKDGLVMRKLSNRKCVRIFRHEKLFKYHRILTNLGEFGSNGFNLGSEIKLQEGGNEHFELSLKNGEEKVEELELGFISENESSDNARTRDSLKGEKLQNGEFGVLDFDVPLQEESKGRVVSKAEDLMNIEDIGNSGYLELEDGQVEELSQFKRKPKHKPKAKMVLKSKKQLMKRSSILAKQVIGSESACSLGFVSQLWVDASTWAVLEVEVRPNLLSSESGRLLLEDINKVGDVVLVQEENYTLNEFRTVGLESLVGYSVLTSGGINLGKVRGYTFDIDSGSVDSLELDAFGYSIIPSSLVSTYALFVEDVLEVALDVIIVHKAAASRIQKLTKGFLGTKNTETSRRINRKHQDLEDSTPPLKDRKSRRKSRKREFNPGTRDLGNDFEIPMDYM